MISGIPAREPRTELVILGVGNLLCRDDGLGVTAVAELSTEYDSPPAVRILDGGTLGLALLPFVAGARRAILVDAVTAPATPGSLVRLEGDELAAAGKALSGHQVGVGDLVAAMRLTVPAPEVVLLGLVPRDVGTGIGLSPELRRALPRLLDRIAEEARRSGCPLVRRAARSR